MPDFHYVSDEEYINSIHFWDATILEQWRSDYTGLILISFC